VNCLVASSPLEHIPAPPASVNTKRQCHRLDSALLNDIILR